MAIAKLFRIIVRQRVRFTPGIDSSVPEDSKPFEVEGSSIERDITDYVQSYAIPRSRESLSSEAKITLISPQGLLNPENHKSAMNLSPIDGTTFTPLLAEGNEVLIYRVTNTPDISTRANWLPRFRGIIRSSTFSTDQGQDTLEITAGDILSRATKATVSGTFSPVVRTSSAVPANSFYTLPTLTTAVTKLRTINAAYVQDTYTDLASRAEPGEISSDILARLISWDRDDVYWCCDWDIAHAPRWILNALGEVSDKNADGPARTTIGTTFYNSFQGTVSDWLIPTVLGTNVAQYIPVNPDTARMVFQVNGSSWYVNSGTVTKDATRCLSDELGALKLANASLKFAVGNLLATSDSRFSLGYRIEDGSSLSVKITRRLWDRKNLCFDSAWDARVDRTVLNQTISGATVFNASLEISGTILNPPNGTTYEFRKQIYAIEPFSSEYTADFLEKQVVYDIELSTFGTVWVDQPTWEFTIIDRDATTGNAAYRDTNIFNMTRLERWTTEDGVAFFDPYESHRSLQPKNLRVIARNLRAPYCAGTQCGYGPMHLKNRTLPENYMYETELVEGQDYEVLVDKGGIQLSDARTRCEIFVSHGYYDLASSSHMEASQMIYFLLTKGAGIPDVVLETTGIILNRIELGVKTTTTVMSALQDLLKQLPSNFHIFADGMGTVYGRFVQQEGSPRIFNPIIQAPISPLNSTILADGEEFWYGLTNLMIDGKETLVSNLMSTVEYQNYFDGGHLSLVKPTTCPVIQSKMAPGSVGLVVRRARAYKKISDIGAVPSLTPAFKWDFNNTTTPLVSTIGTATLMDAASGFDFMTVKELNVENL